jgi:hypothetical protein
MMTVPDADTTRKFKHRRTLPVANKANLVPPFPTAANTPQPAASRQTRLTSSRLPDLCPRRVHKPLSGKADFCESRGTARRRIDKGRICSKRGPFWVPKMGPLLVPKMGPNMVPLFAPFCENGIGSYWESYYGPAKK